MDFTAEYESEKFKKILQDRAIKEIKEDPKQVQAHLISFRRWLKSMPHLSCVDDDDFLLAFLRYAKYNHQKAQTRLDNYCTFRTSETLGCPEFFATNEDDFETFSKYLDLRMSCPLGLLSNGTLVIMVKMGNFDFSIPYEKIMQYNTRLNESSMCMSAIQICGICVLFEFTGITAKHIKVMFSNKESKNQTKYYQEAVPYRIAKLIHFNTPPVLEGIFNVLQHYLNEKIKSKLMFLSGSLEPAIKELPGLKKILPRDYGGNGKTYNDLFDAYRPFAEKIFREPRDFKISVNERKRPLNSQNLLKVYKDIDPETMGKSGTFIKLTSDDF